MQDDHGCLHRERASERVTPTLSLYIQPKRKLEAMMKHGLKSASIKAALPWELFSCEVLPDLFPFVFGLFRLRNVRLERPCRFATLGCPRVNKFCQFFLKVSQWQMAPAMGVGAEQCLYSDAYNRFDLLAEIQGLSFLCVCMYLSVVSFCKVDWYFVYNTHIHAHTRTHTHTHYDTHTHTHVYITDHDPSLLQLSFAPFS